MLQGSLDDFALDEMLGLLSSTRKTGKLEVKGDRGNGSLRLHQGRLVDAGASNTANGVEPEDVLFELLRFGDGNFHFSASDVEEGAFATDVVEVLGSAERRLADWRTIEAIVPSLRHMVSPVPELPTDEVTLDRRDWSVLIVVGTGTTVATVCDELNLGEVEGSRQIKGLTERGLVTVGAPKSTGLRRSGIDAVRAAATSAAPSTTSSTAPILSGSPSMPGGSNSTDDSSNGTSGPTASTTTVTTTTVTKTPAADQAKASTTASNTDGELDESITTAETPAAPAAGQMPARPQPPHPDSVVDGPPPTPAAGLSSLAPAVRQPIDAATSERSGGLLMRYLKNDD